MIHPRNVEGLALLNETCSDVQHIISKILRHGFESYNPDDKYKIENIALLQKELGDLLYSIGLAVELFRLNKHMIGTFVSRKSETIKEYVHEVEIPDRNWIKDLINHRDTTIGLIATDIEIDKIWSNAMKENNIKDDIMLEPIRNSFKKYYNKITFKID